MVGSVPDRLVGVQSSFTDAGRLFTKVRVQVTDHRPSYNPIFDTCYARLKVMDTPQQPLLRRRPKPPSTYSPTASPIVSSSSTYTGKTQLAMSPLPYRTTIRSVSLQLETGATPQRLRDLEMEWKNRRKKALADISNGKGGNNHQQQYGPGQATTLDQLDIKAIDGQHGPSLKSAKNRPRLLTDDVHIQSSQSKSTAARPNLIRCVEPPTPPDTPSTSVTQPKFVHHARDSVPSLRRSLRPSKPLANKHKTESIPNVEARIRTPLTALPILASPLPTTAAPVPLIHPHKGSIHVRPSQFSEFDIFLTHDELLRIISGGMELIWMRGTSDSSSSFRKHLKLRGSTKWTDEEANLWYRVQAIVENLKRKTPQVGSTICEIQHGP